MEPLLTVSSITRSYPGRGGEVRVLDGVSLTLLRGEVVCILGASGCGKSTLLRILCGLERSCNGTVRTEVQRPGQQIGYLTQGERLLPWRTVRDNTALGLEFQGLPRSAARSRAEEVLRRCGMGDFLDAYPDEISGGMTQRALIARLLARSPELLLLDEPLSQLDITGRRQLAGQVQAYVRSSRSAAIVVTHSIEEALFLADRILILSGRPSRIVESFSFASCVDEAVRLDRSTAFDRLVSSVVQHTGGAA